MSDADDPDQLSLVPAPAPRKPPAPRAKPAAPAKPQPEPAAELPVARVAVDTPLAHLDRLFDYRVPADLDERAVPGCRVKVRFAGRLVDGFLVERVATSEHDRLAFLAKVVSPEPVLRPEVLTLARAVADRWAGTLADVLRLAVPPRHARAEAQESGSVAGELPEPDAAAWAPYAGGESMLAALASGQAPRAVWSALPGSAPETALAHAVLATLRSGRGAAVVVPDARDVARVDAALVAVLGEGHHVVLTAAQKPAARYRSFLALARGAVKVVVGTRAAAYAPVRDLGLVACWDDGDDLLVEPRAPYAHVREVLLTRAAQADAGVLLGAYARSTEAQALVASGWCRELSASRDERRAAWPRVDVTDGSVAGGAPARLPHAVFRAIRQADGPVLLQVPRRGYRSSLACQDCRTPARCRACQGPLAQGSARAPVACRWCGTVEQPWTCTVCGSGRLRSPVVGALRTAEEVARAFDDREVVTSGGATVLSQVERGRTLVLATPGAEPAVEGGYALVVLLDTWLALSRDDVRVFEEAHRRWFNALALAGPGARAVVVGEPAELQALVRADPVAVVERELADRAEVHLPPTSRLATVDGPPEVLAALAARPWTPDTEVLGPVPLSEDAERLVLRAPRSQGLALSAALRQVQAERSAAKLPPVRVQVDPLAL
ncbi:primosomal protein N' [Aeromicrobium massiliense]|uniref:primosomal protein N' n=1 Tax=Aeromicrobium massiliense TaxID=1464554 RepID=UPI0009DB638D|nr:primosomal protein N' [Aeromicrobium massiliense]